MDKFWLDKAHKYIQEHNAFESVSGVDMSHAPAFAVISATVSIGLPSMYIHAGITDAGVKTKEPVDIIFPPQFPLTAPKIRLRPDFPRHFPHINPSESDVYPCVFDGEMSELLQQSEWMNGILNQLVDWLEKAAANDLLNYDQGWEAMRNDHCAGFMLYKCNEVLDAYATKNTSAHLLKVYCDNQNGFIITGDLCSGNKKQHAHVLYIKSPGIQTTYLPNEISNLSHLYEYAKVIGISDLAQRIEHIDKQTLTESLFFVVLTISRPINLINDTSNIEFLNFIIHKSKARKGKKGFCQSAKWKCFPT